jgi:hypothetical protein
VTRIGILEEIPRSGVQNSDSLPFLMGHLGVRAPYAIRRKLRVKTELIIITILHIIIITTSILNLGFKTFAPKILAHTTCINRYWKYTQIFAAKSEQNLLQKQAKLTVKINWTELTVKSFNLSACLKY